MFWRDGRAAVLVGASFATAEIAMMAVSSAFAWPADRWLAACAAVVAVDLAVALVLCVGVGGLARRLGMQAPADTGLGGGAAALMLAWPLASPGITQLLAEEQGTGAALLVAAMLAVVVGVAVAVRAVTRPDPPFDAEVVWQRRPFPVATIGALVLVLAIGLGLGATRTHTVAEAPATGPSVLLVTVDGLGADAVPASLRGLTDGGVVFTDAVTPMADVRAANTTVLVGLHPLRHRVLDRGDPLSRGYVTLFEAFTEAGWATAAFVSSDLLSTASGLAQGADTYDDAVAFPLPALLQALWAPRTRGALLTAQRFATWLAPREDAVFAWVHLSGSNEALAAAGEALQQAIKAHHRPWVVAVLATHGAETVGLTDPVVHIPLALRWPGSDKAVVNPVDVQVRLMDVAPTLLEAAGVAPLTESEGVPLIGYATGVRRATLSCALVGWDQAGRPVVGVRNNRVKVLFDAAGQASVYLLADDPAERTDRASTKQDLVRQATGLVEPDRRAFLRLVGG